MMIKLMLKTIFQTGIILPHAHTLTESDGILQLCKVSSVLVHPLRRSCTSKTWTDGRAI